MQMFYSASTGGFYSVETHGAEGIPADAKEISDDLYTETAGRWVVPDANGYPSVYVPPIQTPQQVTMRQARLALLSAGILPDVDVALANLPSPQRETAQIEWQHGTSVERSSQLVALLAGPLNLTDNALDALFKLAATL